MSVTMAAVWISRWWLVVGCVLPACIYLSPINAPPIIDGVTRVCDPGVTPCDFSDVNAGDDVQLTVSFTDPEHHEQSVTYEWSAVACDGAQAMCAPIAVLHATAATADIPVPGVVGGTSAPVALVRVTIELRDDRGAHDLGGAQIPIHEAAHAR